MHNRGVFVAVFGADGRGDSCIDIGDADHGNEGHHLFFIHEKMVFFRLAEEELGAWRDIETDRLGENRGIASHEVAVDDGVRATSTFALRKDERFVGEGLDVLGVQLDGACAI